MLGFLYANQEPSNTYYFGALFNAKRNMETWLNDFGNLPRNPLAFIPNYLDEMKIL